MNTPFSTVLIVLRDTPASFARSAWVSSFSSRHCFSRLASRTSFIGTGLAIEAMEEQRRGQQAEGQRHWQQYAHVTRREQADDADDEHRHDSDEVTDLQRSRPEKRKQLVARIGAHGFPGPQ